MPPSRSAELLAGFDSTGCHIDHRLDHQVATATLIRHPPELGQPFTPRYHTAAVSTTTDEEGEAQTPASGSNHPGAPGPDRDHRHHADTNDGTTQAPRLRPSALPSRRSPGARSGDPGPTGSGRPRTRPRRGPRSNTSAAPCLATPARRAGPERRRPAGSTTATRSPARRRIGMPASIRPE